MITVDQLIIIGGPSCAGKSYLAAQMMDGDRPRICKQLAISDPSAWLYVGYAGLGRMPQSAVRRLIVHCDMHYIYSLESGFEPLNELINNANEVRILTLEVAPKILIQRIRVRFLKLLLKTLRRPKRMKRRRYLLRAWNTLKNYNHDSIVLLYEEWYRYSSEIDVSYHWVLDLEKSDIPSPYSPKRVVVGKPK